MAEWILPNIVERFTQNQCAGAS
uniref:Uncharacterized protein n=1 Tax=Anguilla anguilla TaxID=7936 RepID=A0A0E9VF92_ANGAN